MDLRTAYLRSWHQAEIHDGDFKDCLLHYLSENLELEVVNPPVNPGYTDGGVCEMGGVTSDFDVESVK